MDGLSERIFFHMNFINLNVEAWVPKVGGAISWKNPLAPCPGLTPFSWHKNQFLCQENCVNRKSGARENLSGYWLYHKCLGPWIFDPRLPGLWEWMNHCLTHVSWHKWELGFRDHAQNTTNLAISLVVYNVIYLLIGRSKWAPISSIMYPVGEGTRPCPFPVTGNGRGRVYRAQGWPLKWS